MLIRSLHWEDLLKEGMVTHSSILAWRIPWTEKPGGLWSIWSQRVGRDRSDLIHTHACSLKGNLWQPRQCIKKQKHHFANKGPYSESYGFSSSRVCMWELDHKEDWATKNWCFWIVALKKTLKSPLNSRRSNQSILKEISPEYSLEGLMLKLQYFGYLMWIADSLEDPDTEKEKAGREGDDRGWDCWMASLTQWI